jgi:hypothetical protein
MKYWGYEGSRKRPPVVAGRYDVEDENVTYGQGSFGWEQKVALDDGPCDDPDCPGPHVQVTP